MSATDKDGDFVTYRIVSGDVDRYFIDSSGIIYLIHSLRGTRDDSNRLIVTATDTGSPSRSRNATVSQPPIDCGVMSQYQTITVLLFLISRC